MINCVAIDDEPIALRVLSEHCIRYGEVSLECYSSPSEGMKYVESAHPDIVFLDIEMNGYNGLDLARHLPAGTCLIFTTAYAQYALDGFEADAVDFLHKPIFYERFVRGMEKALKWLGRGSDGSGITPGGNRRDSITLKVEHKNVVVDLDGICYIEAMDNYVKVFRRGLSTVLSQITMKDMVAMLPADRFLRVHRSYIVGVGAIDRFSNNKIYLHGIDRHIPVGRKYMHEYETLNRIFGTK